MGDKVDLPIRSLKSRGNELADPLIQLEILNNRGKINDPFEKQLNLLSQYPLRPKRIEILQLNVGYMCNLACSHCHVDAAPDRKEVMSRATMELCLSALDNSEINIVDLTGGAPEMNPDFQWFVKQVSKRGKKVIVRSNLTILVSSPKFRTYPGFFADHKVWVIASLPCYTEELTDKQRGAGVFRQSLEAIAVLNELGYGMPDTDLQLDLVYNPVGAFLPPSQDKLEKRYKDELSIRFGLHFNKLYAITNMPIGRYLDYLLQKGKYENYMTTLVNSFNPATVDGLMCRNTLSVGWDGRLFDCDFNQLLNLEMDHQAPSHIMDFDIEALEQREIQLNQHCYGCTAGAGSSCQGALS